MSRADDRLDQAIDDLLAGRDPDRPGAGGLVPTELLPLLAAAEELDDDLAGLRLDPGVASAHLALALRAAPARSLPRPGPRVLAGWRRRVALTAVAAVLATVPAVAASASSLPGDPLWRVKQAVDGVKVMAARSPEQSAATRVGLAAERLDELQRLLSAGPAGQVAAAAARLRQAIDAAGAALLVARAEGVDSTTLAALESRLRAIAARAADLAAGWPAAPGQAGTMTTRVPAEALLPLTSLPVTTLPPATTAPPAIAPSTTVPPPTTTGPPTAPPVLPGIIATPQATTTTTTAPPEPKKKKKKKPRHGHGGGTVAPTTTTSD